MMFDKDYFWHAVRLPLIAVMIAVGVAFTVAVFDLLVNHGPMILDAALSFMLTFSLVLVVGLVMEKTVKPPAPEYTQPRVTHLPRLTMKRIERNPNQYTVRGIQTEWDELQLPATMLSELKRKLAENGKFSYRTRPKGMTLKQYQRVRAFLLSPERGWSTQHQRAATLTELGRENLSPIVRTNPK